MRIIAILTFLLSTSIFANPLCKSKGMLKGAIYDAFMGTSHTLKHRFTFMYQTVSKQHEADFEKFCKEDMDQYKMIGELMRNCLKSCSDTATKFFNGTFERTETKQKELFNECATICNLNSKAQHSIVRVMDEQNCQIKAEGAPEVNNSRDIKDIINEVELSSPNNDASQR